jgi:hypothetical protein
MKIILATMSATILLTAASPALADNMCVHQRDIISTHSDDGKNMTFKMRDGRVLVNHMHGICTDLRYEGFSWNVPATQDICENEQTLKVIHSGQSCTLGKFEVVSGGPPASH